MSYAVTELHLEAQPFTINRAGTVHAPLWNATCNCGNRSRGRRLISEVLRDMLDHDQMHRVQAHEHQLELLEVQRETDRKAGRAA